MIVINITNEQGELLGQTELTIEDIEIRGGVVTGQSYEWIGEKVMAELPSNTEALLMYLGGPDAGD